MKMCLKKVIIALKLYYYTFTLFNARPEATNIIFMDHQGLWTTSFKLWV